MQRKILQPSDLSAWKRSQAYKKLACFIADLAENQESASCERSDLFCGILNLFKELTSLMSLFPRVPHPRFGNPAFRDWHSKASQLIGQFFSNQSSLQSAYLPVYLVESLGNPSRIDYGTGHELCFCIFLLIAWEKRLFQSWGEMKQLFIHYFALIRQLIIFYQLEPAGSHGVWGLDDYQFLPFLLGAFEIAQMSGDGSSLHVPSPLELILSSSNAASQEVENLLFPKAIAFVNRYKSGPFHEHSPTLFSILNANLSWIQIGTGLMKMHRAEVMDKFPVVQHLLFCEDFSF